MNNKTVNFCKTCPFFDGFGAVGQEVRKVICRLSYPELPNLRFGECYADECQLPVVFTKKQNAV